MGQNASEMFLENKGAKRSEASVQKLETQTIAGKTSSILSSEGLFFSSNFISCSEPLSVCP